MNKSIKTEERVPTGVPGVDGLIEGGFIKGEGILLAGGTGSGKSIFSSQFIYNGALNNNEKGVYATLEEDRKSFVRNMAKFGLDFEKLENEGKIIVIDPSKIGGVGLDVNLQYITSKMEELGAGEILLTSMDRDGTKDGYDIELTKTIAEAVSIPVIASGGVGNLEHLYEGLVYGKADAALAASTFHYREYTIKEAKEYLKTKGVTVRL